MYVQYTCSVECRGFESHPRQLIFLRKSDCLGCAVLLCLVCLFDLGCFFLPSFSSLIKTCISKTDKTLELPWLGFKPSSKVRVHCTLQYTHTHHIGEVSGTHTHYDNREREVGCIHNTVHRVCHVRDHSILCVCVCACVRTVYVVRTVQKQKINQNCETTSIGTMAFCFVFPRKARPCALHYHVVLVCM